MLKTSLRQGCDDVQDSAAVLHSLGLGLVGRGGSLTAEGDGGRDAISFTLEGDCRLSSGGLFKALTIL